MPADTRDVGIVEFVATEDHHRRKGVADALMARMLADFLADGGQALHLCTTNPIAGRLYENHGFWYRVGDGMRYSAKDAADFDAAYLAFDGDPVVRDAVWGDLPRAAVLYNAPEPAWLLKDILTDCLRDTRYEYHFVRLMRRVENAQGAALVLATPNEPGMVGRAAFVRRDTYAQQHVATLSLRVAPAYMDHAVGLLRAAVDRAAEIGVGVLDFPIAASDADLAAIAGAAGFTEAARLPDRIRDGQAWVDVRLFTLSSLGFAGPCLPRVGNLLRQPSALASRAHRRRVRQAGFYLVTCAGGAVGRGYSDKYPRRTASSISSRANSQSSGAPSAMLAFTAITCDRRTWCLRQAWPWVWKLSSSGCSRSRAAANLASGVCRVFEFLPPRAERVCLLSRQEAENALGRGAFFLGFQLARGGVVDKGVARIDLDHVVDQQHRDDAPDVDLGGGVLREHEGHQRHVPGVLRVVFAPAGLDDQGVAEDALGLVDLDDKLELALQAVGRH